LAVGTGRVTIVAMETMLAWLLPEALQIKPQIAHLTASHFEWQKRAESENCQLSLILLALIDALEMSCINCKITTLARIRTLL